MLLPQVSATLVRCMSPQMADSVEKVGSRSLKEIQLNDNAIFDLICLPPQIDYGRLGLTRSRAMRSPASFPKDSAYDAAKILQCPRTDFFNRIGPSRHFAATQQFGCLRSEADIERFSLCIELVALDPNRTWRRTIACY